MEWIKPGTNIDFMGKTRLCVTASAIAVTISLLGILVWPGPRLGVDFAGGASLQVKMKQGVTPADIQQALTAQGYESPEVVVAEGGSFLIKVRVDAPSDESRDALADAIRKALQASAPAPAPAPEAPAVPADATAADAAAAAPPPETPPVEPPPAQVADVPAAPPAAAPADLPGAATPAPPGPAATAPAPDGAAAAPTPPPLRLPLAALARAALTRGRVAAAKQAPDAAATPAAPPSTSLGAGAAETPEEVQAAVTGAAEGTTGAEPPEGAPAESPPPEGVAAESAPPETAPPEGVPPAPESAPADAGGAADAVLAAAPADAAGEAGAVDAAVAAAPVADAGAAETAVAAAAPAAGEAPAAVRVDEVIVDTSGAKVNVLVNRQFSPEELRELIAPIQFEGRAMQDMLGKLVSETEAIRESRTAEGRFRYDVELSPVVNLNEQDIGRVQELVKGAVAAAGLAAVDDIRAVEVVLAPISLRIDAEKPIDRAGLARVLDETRYRDINLIVRCRSSICPVSIDKRDQVFGYEIALRGFGPDVVESLQERLGKDAVEDVLSMEWVGPKVGEKLRYDGIKSVLIALLLILVYVALRFDLRFAPGAVLCLFHDAIITLGFFTFTRMEVNLTTVAAILTIVGYSINDTIVVYDRIRENLQKTQERDLSKVINTSINETLSRTLLTSFTTILAILAVTFFGRGTIQDFSIAMTVGIVVGTYSSIYVAAPLSILIDRQFFHRNA